VAVLVLGRVLYRLGRREFVDVGTSTDSTETAAGWTGAPETPTTQELSPKQGSEEKVAMKEAEEKKRGLSAFETEMWRLVAEQRVADTLLEEARKERGHRTAIALARDAVWNWRRGLEEGGLDVDGLLTQRLVVLPGEEKKSEDP